MHKMIEANARSQNAKSVAKGGTLGLVLLAAIIAGAVVIRFMHIGLESLWLDEGASVGIARLAWGEFFRVLWHREGNMALYYLLLRGWMVFGSGDAWVRGLSAVFSIATVPFIYLLGKDVRSERAGLIAALLFAASPFAIAYAQEARGYSLVTLLLTIATWALVRAARTQEARWWMLWTIAMGASVYVHLFVVFVLLAHIIYLYRSRVSVEEIRKRLAIIALIWLPMIAFVTIRKAGQLHWVPKLTAKGVIDALSELSGGGDLALMIGVLVILAAVLMWRKGQSEDVVLVWLWLVIPIGLIVVISIFRPLLVPRFLILELPALMLVAAFALAEMPRALGLLLLAAAVFFGVRTGLKAWGSPTKDDFRSATAYVLEYASPKDGIIFDQALGRQAYEHYAQGRPGPEIISPAHGQQDSYQDFEFDPPEVLALKLQSAQETVWVMLNRCEDNGKLDRYAQFVMAQLKRNRQCEMTGFRGIEVVFCRR